MKKIITIVLMLCVLISAGQTTPGKHSIKSLNINTKEANFGVALMGDNQNFFSTPSENVKIIKILLRENKNAYLYLKFCVYVFETALH